MAEPKQTMRAAVITGARDIEVRTVAAPVPGPRQVLIRVEGCGVCGSNLPVWTGRPWFEYPRSPGSSGHEGWGSIAARGAEVSGWEVGQRVAFLSDHAFAELDVADQQGLVELPAALDGHDIPCEALGCAMNIWRRSEVRAGHTVAIVGVGFVGALLVELAVHAGARVIAVSQRPWSLALARHLGAEHSITLDQDDDLVLRRIAQLTGGDGCERVIEAVGLQRPLDLAGRMCAVRGRLVIAGFHQDGPREVDMQLWNWRGLDVINAHERSPRIYAEGMRAAVDALLSDRIDLGPLLTHRIPLDHIDHAFELLRVRPEGFVKAVVTP